jgi:hypothetical protein
MFVSEDGTVHVVWADTRDDNNEIYYRRQVGGMWESEVRLTNDPNLSDYPCIAQGQDGRLHVAWVDTRDGDQEIYYKACDATGGWSADERVTSYSLVDRSPAIAVGDTAVYLAWERHVSPMKVYSVFFSQRTAAGWSAPIEADLAAYKDCYRPSLAFGSEGLLHLVFERETASLRPDEKEKIVHKSWDGSAWSGRTGLSSDVSYSRGPVVAVGSDSTVHVVWQDGENIGGDIFYTWYDGASWQATEQIVTGGAEASMPSIAVDGNGGVHVVWVDHRHGQSEVYSMSKDGSSWGAQTRLTNAVGASMLPTVAANGPGKVCVVWTDLRHGNAEVYFVSSSDASGIRDIPAATADGSWLYLSQPYPVPFTSKARIDFTLHDASDISLQVFDVSGRLVRTLAEGRYSSGSHHVFWDGKRELGGYAVPGVYFILCRGPRGKDMRRVVLVR